MCSVMLSTVPPLPRTLPPVPCTLPPATSLALIISLFCDLGSSLAHAWGSEREPGGPLVSVLVRRTSPGHARPPWAEVGFS